MRIIIILSLSLAGLIAWSKSDATSAPHPTSSTDASWVFVGGTVVSVEPMQLVLQHDGGRIRVAFDDWTIAEDRLRAFEGRRVLVYGRLDFDFYDLRRLRAASLYVEQMRTQYYPSGRVDTDYEPTLPTDMAGRVELVGAIASVSGWNLTVQTSAGPVEIDTRSIPHEIRRNLGYQNLTVGDRVRVSGRLADGIFGRSLEAQVITLLSFAS